ncbi:MAG: hypothetical protein OXU61_00405, partial [Gammaproteobacteria bacterium]|nr:hypothetical protein [Gammaproteobacteria bacterium]
MRWPAYRARRRNNERKRRTFRSTTPRVSYFSEVRNAPSQTRAAARCCRNQSQVVLMPSARGVAARQPRLSRI